MSTTKTKPTPAQYEAIAWAVVSDHGIYPGGIRDVRKDVIKRCVQHGWLSRVGNELTALGFLAWLNEPGDVKTDKQIASAIAKCEVRAYREEKQRQELAARKARERAMFKAPTSLNMTLPFNEWFAIADSLDQAAILYRPDMHGVDLHTLAETIRKKYRDLIEKTKEFQ